MISGYFLAVMVAGLVYSPCHRSWSHVFNFPATFLFLDYSPPQQLPKCSCLACLSMLLERDIHLRFLFYPLHASDVAL
jgi:hypothetical protein